MIDDVVTYSKIYLQLSIHYYHIRFSINIVGLKY